jgi:hypothetical protein
MRGGHFEAETGWSKIVLRTANLHEWIPDTGISTDFTVGDDGRTQTLQVERNRPTGRVIELGGDAGREAGTVAATPRHRPHNAETPPERGFLSCG